MNNEIVLYQANELSSRIDVRVEAETVWLNRNQLAVLFNRDVKTISKHINNVFSEGELDKNSTVSNFATVQNEGGRKIERFPDSFCFQLTEREKSEVVANCDHLLKLKYSYTLPYAFSEHGVVMLSSILRSAIAVKINIRIVKAFVDMRKLNNSDFKPIEFERFKMESGTNCFVLSPQKWIESTNAKGIISKSGRK